MAAPLNIKISTLTVQERTSSQTKACSVDTRATAAAVPPEVLLWCNLATATQGGKQFHQMSHRKWARCLHMTERDEERRWGARFSYCSSCPCIVFFFCFSSHLGWFPSRCFFIPAVQFSISLSLFHLPSATLPYPQLNSIPGVFLLWNIHVTITFRCDRYAAAAPYKVAFKPACLGSSEMWQPAQAFMGTTLTLFMSLLLARR